MSAKIQALEKFTRENIDILTDKLQTYKYILKQIIKILRQRQRNLKEK